jgi:anaerobic selenocysteine-containing dehydrogenase
MAPGDASRLGLAHGDKVTVSADGAGVRAVVALRAASPAGSVFLEDGIPVDAANVLDGPLVDIRKA